VPDHELRVMRLRKQEARLRLERECRDAQLLKQQLISRQTACERDGGHYYRVTNTGHVRCAGCELMGTYNEMEAQYAEAGGK